MTTAPTSARPVRATLGDLTLYGMWDDESYLVASDVPAPFVGTAITL